MQRDHSPIQRCNECGTVTVMLVFEQGLDDNGEPYRAIYRDVVPHQKRHCDAMVALAREEWPTLF